jgi:hypothetical protein
MTPRGASGVPKFFSSPNLILFCEIKLGSKFHKPRTTPSWRKVFGSEKKERRKEKYSQK